MSINTSPNKFISANRYIYAKKVGARQFGISPTNQALKHPFTSSKYIKLESYVLIQKSH
jgi:hypothetical protein